ncbi:MAG: MATE family efflux transporter [Erysipelotrichaceae bacterium]|nr:MATE family efflux transporter [Erysipelotrichaceae bacterium]
MNKEKSSMLTGTLWDKILLFALPLAASSILQQLFNSADVAVVGRFAGTVALAAVSSNGSIIGLLVNSFVGMSVGANVVIANYIGQERMDHVKKAIHNAITLAVIIGLSLMVIGIVITPYMLRLIGSPAEVFPYAVLYLRIYFIGVPFIILYNFEAAVLRSHGQTQRPVISLSVAGVINIILNLILVIVFKMSVAGVAIATVVSNIVSSMDLLFYLLRDKSGYGLNPKELEFDPIFIKQILRVGLPAGLQGAVFSISNLVIQSSVNSFGPDTIAASGAALNFEMFAYYLLNAFGQAAVTFSSQNFGAKQYKRCLQATRCALIEGGILVTLLSGLFIIFRYPLVHIFTASDEVARIAAIRMVVVLSLEFFNMSDDVISGGLRGIGYAVTPTVICIAGICGVRIAWVTFALPFNHNFQMLMYCYPLSWMVTTTCLVAAYFTCYRRLMASLNTPTVPTRAES